ncbi:exocyst complex component EXO70H1-like [Typha latifolia]|uniref:exocyst complex component EXO70H1-like n=1 Tax=Typha latifolia TaxID=4733 RepID=UPI003C2B81E6
MSLKGLRRSLCSFPHHHHSRPTSSLSRNTFAFALMEDSISSAASIVTKWSTESSSSLFLDFPDESARFLAAVSDLHRAMLFFVSDSSIANSDPSSRSAALVRAQSLLQSAMRRLELELHHLLSSLPDLDLPESDDQTLDSLAAVAAAMLTAGYGKECIKVYKALRRQAVNRALVNLGFEKLTPSQIQKLDPDQLDLKIRSWLAVAPAAVRSVFSGERSLCDHVFAGNDSIRLSLFADIARDAAAQLLTFPEFAARGKRAPDRLFRILDLYDAVADLFPEIESVFEPESTAAVRSQTVDSLFKLAEAARSTLADFEAAIQKDSSKSLVPGGGVHPLSGYVMNYLVLLADYEDALPDIFADSPFQISSSVPDSVLNAAIYSAPSSLSSDDEDNTPGGSTLSARIAWLILVLLCKLDSKAEIYREVGLSYLFLANNLQYLVNKVKNSRLREILGEEWVESHERKARHYAESYERVVWVPVAVEIPAAEAVTTVAEARERMRAFTAAMEAAVVEQEGWVVADAAMREEVRSAVADMVVPAYRGFYGRCAEVLRAEEEEEEKPVVRFAPEDVADRIAELFLDGSESGSGSGSGSGSSRSGSGSLSGKLSIRSG